MMTDTLEQAQKDGRAPWTNVMLDTRDFVVYEDIYPVTEGHTLVVPKTNNQEEVLKCFKFALTMGNDNVASSNTNITGFNIGLNTGATFNWIKQDWQSSCFPNEQTWDSVWDNNVRFAVITENLSSNFGGVRYYAHEVNKGEESVWLVYPWENVGNV